MSFSFHFLLFFSISVLFSFLVFFSISFFFYSLSSLFISVLFILSLFFSFIMLFIFVFFVLVLFIFLSGEVGVFFNFFKSLLPLDLSFFSFGYFFKTDLFLTQLHLLIHLFSSCQTLRLCILLNAIFAFYCKYDNICLSLCLMKVFRQVAWK